MSGRILTHRDAARWLAAYTDMLAERSALDFDDLLVRCKELFQKDSSVLAGITHVLVDEFQVGAPV
jgi:superfamily I DNA/RNA helicase